MLVKVETVRAAVARAKAASAVFREGADFKERAVIGVLHFECGIALCDPDDHWSRRGGKRFTPLAIFLDFFRGADLPFPKGAVFPGLRVSEEPGIHQHEV
ncbi:hypothetical protein CHELA20_50804 [Hyphomicrobiales bacterium]|nr:hypothetical protein CHELA20_50804 [Hyphomicrobiales bacterium]